ncbi:hypothetical protein [Roseivirga misakiensis]|uniref:Uncharacterized protein n=1 Tax=Roseivirga misakiensis TaxID=1563681 RepID=A0A1E5SZH1_9BACT|nr:hypothetical protein [Roseivirga misakiensis]OEK04457.1 hypothetical protein BFP71_13365 [Roseivirga misakiensis]
MKKFGYLGMVVVLLAVTGCAKKDTLGDFDTAKWQEDINGCQAVRAEMIDDLIEVKKDLLGLYQKSIIKLLGQPEEQELSDRSQTYYSYYIDPAPSCENGIENPRILEIRFTSLGIANEVNIK